MKGWECPKCSAVMSPYENVCVNCKGITVTTGYHTPSPATVAVMNPIFTVSNCGKCGLHACQCSYTVTLPSNSTITL